MPGGKSPVQNDENNKSIQAEYLDTTINKLTKERVKTRDNYVKELQMVFALFSLLNMERCFQINQYKELISFLICF